VSQNLFYGLDEGAIDAPTLAGRLVQLSVLLVKQCSEEWWSVPADQRERISGGFPSFVVVAIRNGAKETVWETRPRELQAILKAAANIAHRYGPEPR
jgi:hypothetical protein